MGRFALLGACLLIENSQQRTIATTLHPTEAKRSVRTLEQLLSHYHGRSSESYWYKQCVSLAFTMVLYIVSVKQTVDSMLI